MQKEGLFLDFKLKIDLNMPLDFSFSDTFRDDYQGNKSEICSTYRFTEYV